MDTGRPTDNGVSDVTVKLNNVSLAQKDVAIPAVKIEVTQHEEDKGDTEVREVNTAKTEGGKVEETKEVTKVSKTSTPGGGGQVTTQTTTKTTRKGFVGRGKIFAKERFLWYKSLTPGCLLVSTWCHGVNCSKLILNAFSDLNYQLTFHDICTQLPE